jgi:hypothetical protein
MTVKGEGKAFELVRVPDGERIEMSERGEIR